MKKLYWCENYPGRNIVIAEVEVADFSDLDDVIEIKIKKSYKRHKNLSVGNEYMVLKEDLKEPRELIAFIFTEIK